MMKLFIKKRLKSITAILLVATAIVGVMMLTTGCACDGNNSETPDPTPVTIGTGAPTTSAELPTQEPVPFNNDIPSFDGGLAAAEAVTYGIATDGSIRFIGNSASGQNLIYDWENVVQVAVSDSTTAALLADGTIRLTGTRAFLFETALLWTDIVQISMGDNHLVALKKDGSVVAVGDSTFKQCNVTEWSRVHAIYAAGDYTVALAEDGVYSTLGNYFQTAVQSYNVIAAAAAPDHVALLLDSNTVIELVAVPTREKQREYSGDAIYGAAGSISQTAAWIDIVKVFAATNATYGIDRSGRLYATGALITESLDDVYCVAASATHAVVLYGSGLVEGFGDNGMLQCNVSGWRLLPYLSGDNYILGYNEGDVIGSANGDVTFATGVSATYIAPATQIPIEAVCVLLGDVNGDGAINETDAELVEKHISGEAPLTGAYLRAANIIMDETAPDAVDVVDLEELRAHIAGNRKIDQFAKTDVYTTPLADARRVNLDALGYITIGGTNISYPIMYGDNWFYNDHGLDRQPITRGSIYYYWSSPNKNIVLTGHNSRPTGVMFHELHNVQDNSAALQEYSERVWYINSYGQSGYWEIWSMYEENPRESGGGAEDSSQYYNTCWPNTMDAMNEYEISEWIQYQRERSEVELNVNVSVNDRFMTIVTCGDSHADSQTGARLYFFLRWVSAH